MIHASVDIGIFHRKFRIAGSKKRPEFGADGCSKSVGKCVIVDADGASFESEFDVADGDAVFIERKSHTLDPCFGEIFTAQHSVPLISEFAGPEYLQVKVIVGDHFVGNRIIILEIKWTSASLVGLSECSAYCLAQQTADYLLS